MGLGTYMYPWLARAFKAGQGERLYSGNGGSKSFAAVDILRRVQSAVSLVPHFEIYDPVVMVSRSN